MCGISGIAGEYVPGLIERMNLLQAHRGPDGQGRFEDPDAEIALGHTRLAVLDLSEYAAQPMHTPDGRYVLVYNGEIYNFLELHENLEKQGCTFKSTGDTEVLLRGLQIYGPSFIEKLNGMFAFALWDRKERNLLLARDQLGIKPLYYAEPKPGVIIFASEIKAICACPAVKREPDFTALYQHMAYCHPSGSRTAFKGIQHLAPGSILQWSAASKKARVKEFWKPSFNTYDRHNRKQAVEELRELVKSSVKSQLVSDVPVGTLLSGGIDSSLITTVAAGELKDRLSCYTITYPSSENILDRYADDTPYARDLAKNLGLELVELEIKPEMVAMWPKLIYHLDEPTADPAAIASYLISKTAKENGTTVLLSGQGGDELFGGYVRYQAMYTTDFFNHVPAPIREMISSGAQILPGSLEGKWGAGLRRVKRVLADLDQSPDARFLAYCAGTPYPQISNILSRDFHQEVKGTNPTDECLRHMDMQGLNGVDRFLERDLSIYLPNHNLQYTDKTGMAVGLEVRVPLLDMSLVNEVTHYPNQWKVSRGTTKVILREAAQNILPTSIIRRPKAGFGAPYRKWLRYDLEEMWNDLTNEKSVNQRGWFNYSALKQARQKSQSGRNDLYMLQWIVLTIELWARIFIDQSEKF